MSIKFSHLEDLLSPCVGSVYRVVTCLLWVVSCGGSCTTKNSREVAFSWSRYRCCFSPISSKKSLVMRSIRECQASLSISRLENLLLLSPARTLRPWDSRECQAPFAPEVYIMSTSFSHFEDFFYRMSSSGSCTTKNSRREDSITVLFFSYYISSENSLLVSSRETRERVASVICPGGV